MRAPARFPADGSLLPRAARADRVNEFRVLRACISALLRIIPTDVYIALLTASHALLHSSIPVISRSQILPPLNSLLVCYLYVCTHKVPSMSDRAHARNRFDLRCDAAAARTSFDRGLGPGNLNGRHFHRMRKREKRFAICTPTERPAPDQTLPTPISRQQSDIPTSNGR